MSTSASLVGRLTRDPEMRNTPSGMTIANMRVAVDRVGDKQDDGSYASGFFDVTAFGKTAENVEQYLHKGSQLAVFGRLAFHEWEAKDGSGKRSKIEIHADRITFVGSKADADAERYGGQPQATIDEQPPEDDIPFMPTIDGLGN